MGHSAPEGEKVKYMAGGAFAKARGCGAVVHVNKHLMGHSSPEGGTDKYMAGGAFAKARGCGTVVHVNKHFSFSQR